MCGSEAEAEAGAESSAVCSLRAVCAVCACAVTLLEGDVIDEAPCIDVRRIRLRTYVTCSSGLGLGLGPGIVIPRNLAAAHSAQIELATALHDVVEPVARHLVRVRGGAEAGVARDTRAGGCRRSRGHRLACKLLSVR